jgi:hypothetical protein
VRTEMCSSWSCPRICTAAVYRHQTSFAYPSWHLRNFLDCWCASEEPFRV